MVACHSRRSSYSSRNRRIPRAKRPTREAEARRGRDTHLGGEDFDNRMMKHFLDVLKKKYGKPIEHWMKELKKVAKLAHMEQVAHLKEKFEMGHGHANAIVAVFRSKNGL